MRRSSITVVVLLVAMFAPLTDAVAAAPGGPLVLMGIDAEDGGVGGHGPLSTYAGVATDILANVLNGGSGILVIGGGKAVGDHVTTWWDALGASVGQTVTHVSGPAISTVSFAGKAMIGVASSEFQTFYGGLTDDENSAFATREADLTTFVNNGGGLLGFSQDGLSASYPYLNALGAFTVQRGRSDSDVTPTAEGAALGLDATSLDVCCWHDAYLTYPDFLKTLLDFGDGRDAAIGGKNIVIPRLCTDAEMPTTAITRPAAGRVYLDNADVGAAPTSEALVKGFGLTLTGAAGPTVNRIEIRLDNVLLATPTVAPFSTTVSTPGLGQHTVKITAWNDALGCFKIATSTFTVACVGVGVAITRPSPGRAYLGDADVGSSGGPDPFLLGGLLRTEATSADLAHTTDVSFAYDAGSSFGADTSGNPFDATTSTDPLGPGTHLLRATLRETQTACVSTAVVLVRRVSPKVKAVAEGVFVTTNIPAEPQVHAGGAQVTGDGGTSTVRVVNRSAGPVDYVHAVTDSASGSIAPFTSRGDSLVTDLSINAGLITADALHAKVRADYDIPTLTGSGADDGSQIVNLKIANVPYAHVAPNTVVTLPGGLGRVVLQETIVTTAGFTREVTVNMIHAWITTPTFKGEVILGSAHAGVSLPGGPFFGPENDLIHRADDAGSGVDAGGTRATALVLAEGTYGGGLLSADDASDFYSFQAGQGDRISVTMVPAIRERISLGAGPSPSLLGPTQPDFDLILRDPNGDTRDISDGVVGGSAPRHVELNADIPFAPAGARATWTVEVVRQNPTDGFYTLDLHIPPSPLLDQADANLPGDASASCAAPRALSLVGAENETRAFTGVIRDDDQGDTYSLRAEIGQTLAVALKPDAGAEGANLDLFLHGPDTINGPTDCASAIANSELGAEPLPKSLPDLVTALPVRVTGTYVFEVRRINGVANYAFEVSLVNDQPTLPNNDASTGADAGDACTEATAITSGLHQGRLGDIVGGDQEDWYAINLGAAQDLTAIMKSADPNDFTLSLFRPDCTAQPADQFTVSALPLSAPETAHVRDAAAGLWKLRVRQAAFDGGNYALSIAVTP